MEAGGHVAEARAARKRLGLILGSGNKASRNVSLASRNVTLVSGNVTLASGNVSMDPGNRSFLCTK